ncbi:DUF3102 domain-containing protein [Solibacillus sp. FSL R7-0682]|uniref:DUF3102 domain-containing protein n=1 Tax=Solibacillus sp. FSL R7-0682 TaxID=2921690 RepID=UPI0030FB9946
MENAVSTLSTDIHVITAEINAYQRVAGEAIFEIGKRLKHVKENDLAHGEFGKWLESVNLHERQAQRLIRVAEEFGVNTTTWSELPFRTLYEIATLPTEERNIEHELKSGETKFPKEMTVRELAEVKAELKRKQAELDEARRSEQIALTQNERLSDELATAVKPETVVVEKEVERSIEVNGIRDAIKCTPAFTVISGHQRLRIAKDLGLSEVPVEIIDVDEWEAEYLLIAENVERRGLAEQDPIKKGRIAKFMAEYWDVRLGRGGDKKSTAIMANDKTVSDVAEFIGESKRVTERLLKLNELIPQLKRLVSSGKLGTTSAEQLAYLTPEVQTALYDALGEEIGERTVAETKQLRQEAVGKSVDDIQRMLDAEKKAKEQALAERATAFHRTTAHNPVNWRI